MKKALLLCFIISCYLTGLYSQTTPTAFGVRFTGFVRSDVFIDTRENIVMRDGMINLYPEAPSYDAAGNDINEKLSFNFLCISSRLRAHLSGPGALGARTSGLIEMEFFGTSDADINGFRMRHAFVDLNWARTEVRVGQYWHPMFVMECFPQTVSFSTGSPFNIFNRSPQIKVTHHAGRSDLIAAIATERDFNSPGPDPSDPSKIIHSTRFIKNSGLPEVQLQFKHRFDSLGKVVAGVGIGGKKLRPELYTIGTNNLKHRSNEDVSSFSGFAFLKMAFDPVEIRLTGIYCQNAYDLTLLGGYAVKEILDEGTGQKKFTPLNTFACWADFQYVGKNWKTGIFTGLTSNLGAGCDLSEKIFYSRGSNIAYVYRFAPRFTFTSGKMDLGFELEYTVAAYGTVNYKGKVDHTKEVQNIRPLVNAIYNF
ncbi:MAG: hypothetical protein AB9842_04125 [Bacteroidales bacterium]